MMYGGSFGHNWAWVLIGVCAVIGFFSAIYFLVKGIIWLFNHVQII